MSNKSAEIKDKQYTSAELFEKNHIKSTKIMEKIKLGKIPEILEGIGYITDKGLVIDIKYPKYFANPTTYDLIVHHWDTIFSQVLTTNNAYTIYINIQSLSLADIDKHYNFCKYIANYFALKYPDKLHKCYIYNASIVFETLINIISKFIDPVTIKKIHLVKE
jgi:hypothetical protein